jgi:hypothetical protein
MSEENESIQMTNFEKDVSEISTKKISDKKLYKI